MSNERLRIEKKYYDFFGCSPNLDQPKTFNEKILWIRLNEHYPLRHRVADKIEVRNYWIEQGLGEYVNTIYWYGNDLSTVLRSDLLPIQFIIKASYGCNMNLVVWDNSKFEYHAYSSMLEEWMTRSDKGYEWAYRGLPKRLMIEKLLIDSNNKLPSDYKFWVLNGKVELIQANEGRIGFYYTDDFEPDKYTLKRFFYTVDWKVYGIEYYDKTKVDDYIITPPSGLDRMLGIAERIGKDFTFIRVDFYCLDNDKIVLGELTNYPNGGFGIIKPSEIDYALGEKLKLNI